MKKAFILFILLAIVHLGVAQQSINQSSSQATFKVSNLGMKVNGSIRGMYGEAKLDESDLSGSYVKAYLDVKAIRSGNKLRDKHLKQEGFFDMENHPKLSFISSSISKSNGQFMTKGTLTMKGISKEIEIPFTKEGNTIKGSFTVNRHDYKIDNGSFLAKGISDEVTINFTAVLE